MSANTVPEQNVDVSNDIRGRIIAGILILVISIGFVVGIGWILVNPFIAGKEKITAVPMTQVNEALVMLFAGGIGSSIYVIRAYLLHACEKKDLDPDYLPWYFFRQIMGALLGLIFYFAVRGGILLLTVNETKIQSFEELNIWSLAAIGSLVGLFSKYAIEKLRELFLVLFNGREKYLQETEKPQE